MLTEEEITALQEELERTKAALKAANAESAGRRKKIEELETGLAGASALKEQVEAAQAELKKFKVVTAVEKAAAGLGFKHPEDAVALIDLSKVEMAEDGTVMGFEKGLEDLQKSGRLPTNTGRPSGLGTVRGTPPPKDTPRPEADKQERLIVF